MKFMIWGEKMVDILDYSGDTMALGHYITGLHIMDKQSLSKYQIINDTDKMHVLFYSFQL